MNIILLLIKILFSYPIHLLLFLLDGYIPTYLNTLLDYNYTNIYSFFKIEVIQFIIFILPYSYFLYKKTITKTIITINLLIYIILNLFIKFL